MRRTLSSPRKSELKSSASLFAALGDGNRLTLVSRLCTAGPRSIAALSGGLPITRQAVTKHLHVMEDAGLVRSTQHGRERVWELDHRRVAEARQYLESISAQWDRTLSRLKAFVER